MNKRVVTFASVDADWGTISHIGCFVKRPWWQRAIGLVYRPWRRDKMLDHSVLIGGKLCPPLTVEDGDIIRHSVTWSFGGEEPDA